MTYDDLVAKMVERMLYVMEQYTAGNTVAFSDLSEARYEAMGADCQRQLLALMAECLPLTVEEGTPC